MTKAEAKRVVITLVGDTHPEMSSTEGSWNCLKVTRKMMLKGCTANIEGAG